MGLLKDGVTVMKNDSKSCLKPGAVKGVHETVIDLVAKEKRGKLLDAGAGSGVLSKKLKQMEFEVTPCDLDPSKFQAHGMVCDEVNLNECLPYSQDFFDYIVCVEVIEHVENPWSLMKELGRVLKFGGKLIISTPNVINFQSRLYFFLTGELIYFREKDYVSSGHITPMPFWNLNRLLLKENFTITCVKFNRSKIPLTNIEFPIKNIYFGEILIVKAINSLETKTREEIGGAK